MVGRTEAPVPELPGIDVSRETMERLQFFAVELSKWNRTINLVAPNEIDRLWQRHIIDSAQLWNYRHPATTQWVDLGSGGGLPGVVLAVIAAQYAADASFHLVESDIRKAAFLRMIAAQLSLPVTVHAKRAEAVPPLGARTVTARALAPLSLLIPLALPHLAKDGLAIFPKGQSWKDEVAEASHAWRFSVTPHSSVLDSRAAILQISDISRIGKKY